MKLNVVEPPLHSPVYWKFVRRAAEALHSDGCTGVPDFYLEACLEHDLHYRLGRMLTRTIVTRRWADARFRRVIQARSPFGHWSPMSWWRWAGVRLGGGASWTRYREQEAQRP